MFGRKKEPEIPVVQVEEPKLEPVIEREPEPPRFNPFAPVASTRIGQGITMVGNFDTKDPVEINGTIRGNIKSTNSVSISKDGALIGEAALDSLKLEGRIDGTVLCAQDTVFTSTGRMKGNLSTSTLRTDAGSNFEGKLNMIPKKPEPPVSRPIEEVLPKQEAAPDAEPVYETLAEAIKAREANRQDSQEGQQ